MRWRGESLPRARWRAMALSPPPFAIAATCRRRSSTRPRITSALARKAAERGLISEVSSAMDLPAAGREPAVELVEAVIAPERLAIDDEEGRAEDPAGKRLV